MPSDEPVTTICPACAGNVLSAEELQAFAEFVKEMEGKIIPEIVASLKKRAELSNEYRRNNPWM